MPTKVDQDQLLSPEFMAKIEQLEIVSRKIFAGKLRGERRSKRKGESVEFADHRSYVLGDDLRFLDWNILARLDHLFLKLFLEEEDLHVNLMIDVSKSMDWGEPSKAMQVKKIAAALAYIGLVNYDRVSLYGYADYLNYDLTAVRGRRLMHKVLTFLNGIEFEGVSNLAQACRYYALRQARSGVLVILGDFFDKNGFDAGLRYLAGRQMDIYVIQVLSPQEIDPKLTGDLRLVDAEDGDVAEVTVSRPLIDRYKKNLQAYCTSLKEFCTRRGMTYLFTSTEAPFDEIILNYLRRRGMIKQ